MSCSIGQVGLKLMICPCLPIAGVCTMPNLETEPRALQTLGKCATTTPHLKLRSPQILFNPEQYSLMQISCKFYACESVLWQWEGGLLNNVTMSFWLIWVSRKVSPSKLCCMMSPLSAGAFYFLSGSLRPEVSSLFPGLPSGPFSDCALNPAHKTYPVNSFFRCECLGSFYFSNHTNCSGSVSDQHAKQTRAATQFREKHKILGWTTKYGLFYSPLCAQRWFQLTLQPSSLKSIL